MFCWHLPRLRIFTRGARAGAPFPFRHRVAQHRQRSDDHPGRLSPRSATNDRAPKTPSGFRHGSPGPCIGSLHKEGCRGRREESGGVAPSNDLHSGSTALVVGMRKNRQLPAHLLCVLKTALRGRLRGTGRQMSPQLIRKFPLARVDDPADHGRHRRVFERRYVRRNRRGSCTDGRPAGSCRSIQPRVRHCGSDRLAPTGLMHVLPHVPFFTAQRRQSITHVLPFCTLRIRN